MRMQSPALPSITSGVGEAGISGLLLITVSLPCIVCSHPSQGQGCSCVYTCIFSGTNSQWNNKPITPSSSPGGQRFFRKQDPALLLSKRSVLSGNASNSTEAT